MKNFTITQCETKTKCYLIMEYITKTVQCQTECHCYTLSCQPLLQNNAVCCTVIHSTQMCTEVTGRHSEHSM
jgi:hypothetical protein